MDKVNYDNVFSNKAVAVEPTVCDIDGNPVSVEVIGPGKVQDVEYSNDPQGN